MPETRKRGFGSMLGQAMAHTSVGTDKGGGIVPTLQRVAATSRSSRSTTSSGIVGEGGSIEYDSGAGYELAGVRLAAGTWILTAKGAGYPTSTTGYLRLNLRTGAYGADLTDTGTYANAYGAWVTGMPEATASTVEIVAGPILVTAVVTWEDGPGTPTYADMSAIRIA